MRILVHAADAPQWCELLTERLSDDAVVVASDEDAETPADYLVVWQPPQALLERHSHAKAVVCLGAGVDAILANPGLAPNVPVVKLRDAGMAPLMVEYVRYGVMHFRLSFDHYLACESDAHWQPQPRPAPADWPVGVLGLGAIGREVAGALAADGYPVHGWSRAAKALDGIACHHDAGGLDDLLGSVKTLIVLLPDTAATRGIVNARALARLPRGASVINPGRGRLVESAALLDALDNGHVRGAMLDVFATEPLPTHNPLWAHPKVRITPHIAAPTPLAAAADQIAEAIRAIENGEVVDIVERSVGY